MMRNKNLLLYFFFNYQKKKEICVFLISLVTVKSFVFCCWLVEPRDLISSPETYLQKFNNIFIIEIQCYDVDDNSKPKNT